VPLVVSDPVADVVAAAEKLRADDRLIADPAMLLGDVETLADAMTTVYAVLLRRLREAWGVDATAELFGRATKRWLVEDLLLAGADASRLMALLHGLPRYPATQAALDAGGINPAHAHAIVKALGSVPMDVRETVEAQLIERAKHFPPEEIAGFTDQLLELMGIDKDSAIRRERKFAQRSLDVGTTMDGARAVTGTLTPEIGEKLERALALAAKECGPEDLRTRSQRQHDALGAIADSYIAHHHTPSFNGAPRTAIITMDFQTLENRLREQWITLPTGGQISADTARRLACDAEIIPMVLGSNGEPLDVGQANHEFTAAQRRAAYERDGGRCAFPNCRNQVVELHHIVFRRHGGPGTLDNAAWLCGYHHWLVHEGKWTLQRQPDRSYLWTGPRGQQRIRHLSTA
jgi:hypothetical protein